MKKMSELEELRAWKRKVEDLMGQRGIENIKAMLDIIDAAQKWVYWIASGAVREWYAKEPDTRKDLQVAVKAYDDMVVRRALQERDYE
jgi:hypothetical protein